MVTTQNEWIAGAGATRAETVADQIRQAIRAGAYVSGQRLLELSLVKKLNVSQNTVRDALRLLEVEGWVVKRARHGVYVRSFTRDEVMELYTLWQALEGLALGWAMKMATKQDMSRLRRLIQTARKDILDNELEESTEAIFQFHMSIAQMCGKQQTAELLASLHNRVYLLEIVRQMRAPRSLHSHEARLLLYEKLVTLMEVSNFDDAQALLGYLIQSDCESLLPVLER